MDRVQCRGSSQSGAVIHIGGPGMGRFSPGGTRGVRALVSLVSLGATLGLLLVGLPAASAQTANDILGAQWLSDRGVCLRLHRGYGYGSGAER